jgi:hypothetical protein
MSRGHEADLIVSEPRLAQLLDRKVRVPTVLEDANGRHGLVLAHRAPALLAGQFRTTIPNHQLDSSAFDSQ